MTNPTDLPNRVRTSDAERERVVTVLRQAIVEGRLSMTEGEERIAGAYEAKFRDELHPLTLDLPGGARNPLGDTLRDEMGVARSAWSGPGRPGHGPGSHGHPGRPFRGPVFGIPLLAIIALVIVGAATGAFHLWWLIPVAFFASFVVRRIFWWRALRRGRGRNGW